MLYRLGAVFETSMTSFFTWWGTTAARYPLPVIVLSVAFAGNLILHAQQNKGKIPDQIKDF